ncbi:MAG: SAM-dependent methyltransferase, partial [Clostridia bacterium]|nr:SAM-dependent methyltransferase [Clostridia bacterium]
KNNISSKVLACDLRKGPLDNAAENVKKAGCENEIELRLSDGLDSVRPDEADDIIICGMGGTLIADILSRSAWLKNPHYNLVFQPQSHADDLRRYLFENGFEILKEIPVTDEGRDYVVISSAFRKYFDDKDNELKIYFGSLLDNKDEISARIAGRTLSYLKVRMKSEKEYGDLRISEKLKSIIKTAEEKMNED